MDDSTLPPPPKISPDGKFYLDPHEGWQPIPVTPRSGPGVGQIIAGVVAALVIVLVGLWVVTTMASSNDGVDCQIENADRAAEGRPLRDCP